MHITKHLLIGVQPKPFCVVAWHMSKMHSKFAYLFLLTFCYSGILAWPPLLTYLLISPMYRWSPSQAITFQILYCSPLTLIPVWLFRFTHLIRSFFHLLTYGLNSHTLHIHAFMTLWSPSQAIISNSLVLAINIKTGMISCFFTYSHTPSAHTFTQHATHAQKQRMHTTPHIHSLSMVPESIQTPSSNSDT